MGLNLLNLAKKNQKEHKWKQAINYFKAYMDGNPGKCDADTYVSYAKCLRVKGYTNHAEEILIEGRTLHPKNERILLEFHNLYDSLGDWESAKVIANDLIKMDPQQANYYFRLGRTYSYLTDYQIAGQIYKTGLKYRHNLTFEKLIEKIQRGITDNLSEISSQYIFIDGRNNLGALIHNYKGKRYFTKISRYTRGARREKSFYNKVCSKFPSLKQAVPLHIDSQVLDNILYLTLEMIDNVPVTEGHVKEVIEISTKITNVKYDEIVKVNPNPKYLFQLRNRPISIVIFFTKIHEEYYNERLFNSFHRLAKQSDYPEAAIQVINRLESLVMENHLYAFIKPEKHYSLLHGDFIPQNLKLKKQGNIPQVFDWATSTIGPQFIDVARYLTTTFIPYPKIKEFYLANDQTGGKLTAIERIFFLYALILLYLLTSRRKSMEERLSDFILPALNDMETLVKEFKKEGYDHAIQSLLKKREQGKEKKNKIKQLRLKILKLEQEKTELQKRHKDILNSKSWRITMPLRKVIQWKERYK